MEQLTIFCAYAPKDKSIYKNLRKHLQVLEREYRLKIWSADAIFAGINQAKEVDKYFNLACIILLLISSDFIDSDYCNDIEKRALERQQTSHPPHIIPVLLRSVDWRHTAIGHLQILPDNTTPVMLWQDRDQALLNIATGIRRVVETIQSPMDSSTQVIMATNTSSSMKQTLKAEEEVSIKDYIYISDAKIDRLAQQIGVKKENVAPFQQRYQSLGATLLQLERAKKIWDIKSGKKFKTGDYITGICPMRWGTVKWESNVSCFFFAMLPSRIVLMAGSAYHLEGNGQSSKELFLGISSSSLPGIIGAIDFAVENSNVEWPKGVGSISDYLFALAFVRGKFFHELRIRRLAIAFPEQPLEFAALVHKTLSPPSAQDIRSFFQCNVINEKDKQEINRMLSDASEILICSPIYVSLGQE